MKIIGGKIEVETDDFPEGTATFEDGSFTVALRTKYFSAGEVGTDIDKLVKLEQALNELARLRRMARPS